MSDDSTTQCLLFPGIFRKPIVAQFDQREGSSDGGALLLKAADRHYGLVAGLSSCLRDDRQAGKVDHSLRELVAQRVFVCDRLRLPGRQLFRPAIQPAPRILAKHMAAAHGLTDGRRAGQDPPIASFHANRSSFSARSSKFQ